MKKIISLLVIISMVLSLGVLAVSADEEAGSATALNYSGDHQPGIWLNRFNEEGVCNAYAYTIFNAAAPFTAIVLPTLYAGRSENNQNSSVRFELFNFTGEKDASLAAEPIFTNEDALEGDTNNYTIDFGKSIPAGQYIFKISQITDNPERESPGPYAVLPAAEDLYSTEIIEYGSLNGSVSFAFSVVYDGSVESSAFFKAIQWKSAQVFKDDKAVQLVQRTGDAHQLQMADYAILTEEIPEGKVLRYFTFKAAPTWNNTNHDSDLDWDVYVWDTDYETTYSGIPIKSGSVVDHTDNQDLILDFGARLTAGRRYLIVVYKANDGNIGFWVGANIKKGYEEKWAFFEDEEETDVYPACEFKLSTYSGPEETPEPVPTPTATPDVTEAPPVTEEPEQPTEKVEDPTEKAEEPTPTPKNSSEESTSKKKSGCGGFVAGGIVSVCALAAAVVIAKKKH
ncbi:MAG: hypothetical protein K6B54_06190 [Clostridia bacterium]|nr:hypothetical protein [Clostridia bacterium]